MSHEGVEKEETSSVERNAEAALLLVEMEAESFSGNYESPAQKKWADGFAAITRVLQYTTTIPAAPETISQENSPS